MSRPRFAWLIFTVCLLATTAAVGWLTHVAWQADQARQQALFDSEIRNALWRMDSLVAPLLAIEITRPSFSQPSLNTPILAPKLIKGYVVRQKSGQWMIRRDSRTANFELLPTDCPLIRQDWIPKLAEALQLWRSPSATSESNHDAAQNLNELIIWPKANPVDSNRQNQIAVQSRSNMSQNRSQLVQQFSQIAQNSRNARPQTRPDPIVASILEPLYAVWIERELVLARGTSNVTRGSSIELCWLNWPEWEVVLNAQLEGLSGQVHLEPVPTDAARTPGPWQMVSLPIRLVPDKNALSTAWPMPLVAVWGLLLLVAVAFGWLMRETLNLSERRAAFVSAVTHELRTPLTTFRLYTEMLSEGLASDPEQQQVYFQTLHREANRLTHLVENVLAYARLEHGRSTARHERLTLDEILDRCLPRLEQRVSETSLSLSLQASDSVRKTILTTNAMAIEQILFNLVDNSCKYAKDAVDPRVICEVELLANAVRIQVRDFGPGLSSTARRFLFQPFQKSSAEAAESAPGIGLGLALSKRLAFDLGGSLTCHVNTPSGLIFELKLPLHI
jgi:signal transduction histidine kinase